MRTLKIIGMVLLGIVGFAAVTAGVGAVLMLLWNALLPALFGLPVLGFWQAVGLVVLTQNVSRLLFGARRGWGHRPHGRDLRRRWHRWMRAQRVKAER